MSRNSQTNQIKYRQNLRTILRCKNRGKWIKNRPIAEKLKPSWSSVCTALIGAVVSLCGVWDPELINIFAASPDSRAAGEIKTRRSKSRRIRTRRINFGELNLGELGHGELNGELKYRRITVTRSISCRIVDIPLPVDIFIRLSIWLFFRQLILRVILRLNGVIWLPD